MTATEAKQNAGPGRADPANPGSPAYFDSFPKMVAASDDLVEKSCIDILSTSTRSERDRLLVASLFGFALSTGALSTGAGLSSPTLYGSTIQLPAWVLSAAVAGIIAYLTASFSILSWTDTRRYSIVVSRMATAASGARDTFWRDFKANRDKPGDTPPPPDVKERWDKEDKIIAQGYDQMIADCDRIALIGHAQRFISIVFVLLFSLLALISTVRFSILTYLHPAAG